MTDQKHGRDLEPSIAPGLEMDELEADATEEEVKKGESTAVTRLILDRTPED